MPGRRLHHRGKDQNDRWVCAVRIDKCIGCGLCVTIGNPTAPGKRDFGCPADYDAIDMVAYAEAVDVVESQLGIGAPASQVEPVASQSDR